MSQPLNPVGVAQYQLLPPEAMVANQAQWHGWLLSEDSPARLKQLDASGIGAELPMATDAAGKLLQYDDLLQGGVSGAVEGLFPKTVALLTGLFGVAQVARWVFAYRTRYPNPSPYFPPMFAQWPGFVALLPQLATYPAIAAIAMAEWCYLQARLAPNPVIRNATFTACPEPPNETSIAVWNPSVVGHSFLYPIPNLWQQWPGRSEKKDSDPAEWLAADWQAWLHQHAVPTPTPLLFYRNPESHTVGLLAANPTIGGVVATIQLLGRGPVIPSTALQAMASQHHGQLLSSPQWGGVCQALYNSHLLLGWQ